MRNRNIIINGVILGLFLGAGTFLFSGFSPQKRPMSISSLFLTPIPILVAVMIYLTVMGIRKVMEDKGGASG